MTIAPPLAVIEASPHEIYNVELMQDLLEANARLARDNRALLDRFDITAIDVMGAVGSGKTTLISLIAEKLKERTAVVLVNGDATASTDVDLIAEQGIPVVQIATINACHLDANLMGKALARIDLAKTGLILVENIGNLICPPEFPIGAKGRVVVISVTEGAYVVKKHPHLFLGATLVVINKIDLADAMEVRVADLMGDVHRLKPDISVIPTSCRTGAGLEEFAAALLDI